MVGTMPVFLIAACLILGVAGLIFFCLFRYMTLKQRYALAFSSDKQAQKRALPDFEHFVERFRKMIMLPTVSWTDRNKRDIDTFKQFQTELEKMYPRVHTEMDREMIDAFGLIYCWKGKNSKKKPVLFLAHYDVVPAEEKGDETWDEDPFGAHVKDGVLWGRGTLDIKCQLAFQMETAEFLLEKGWQPDRDIYFAFGGDEEIAGIDGAQKIAALFKERGLEFEFVLDEGGVIAKDQLAFLKERPAALVGLAEKGFVTFKITATGESGHSSMPVKGGTAIGRLAKGIVRLEEKPFPVRLDPVMSNMLERFVPYVSFGLGIVFANLWLTRPLILFIFSKNRVTDSLIRTTQAVTVIRAGEQENVLPGEAACLVNHRIIPGDTINMILNRHRKTLKDGGLTLDDAGHWPANDPIRAGDIDAGGFSLIRKVLSKTHPDVITVPYLVNGSTDSKYYNELTGQILRFCPLVLTPDDVASIHGVNEKVSLENLRKGLEFYIELFYHL